MPTLTTKELSALEDQLNGEQLLVKKFKTFASHCNDPQLKAKCNQIADKHQQHFNILMNHLNS